MRYKQHGEKRSYAFTTHRGVIVKFPVCIRLKLMTFQFSVPIIFKVDNDDDKR